MTGHGNLASCVLQPVPVAHDILPRAFPISVVIPSYNCAAVLPCALDAVLAQSSPAQEIIVVDDGSTDETPEVIERYRDYPHIKYVRKTNGGVASARNLGLRHASHDWIAFLDADDYWFSSHLEELRKTLCRNRELRWAAGALYEEKLDGRRRLRSLDPRVRPRIREECYFENAFDLLQSGVWIHTSTMLIHRKCLEAVGVFNEMLRRREDLDLWIRIGHRYGPIGYVARPTAVHVRHSDSLTSTLPRLSAVEPIRWLNRLAPSCAARSARTRRYARFLTKQAVRSLVQEQNRDGLRELLVVGSSWMSPATRLVVWLLAHTPRSGLLLSADLMRGRLALPPQE